jgi:hypothetical protein
MELSTLLKEITKLERDLTEQDTIVQVYRTSLEKDSSALIKVSLFLYASFKPNHFISSNPHFPKSI